MRRGAICSHALSRTLRGESAREKLLAARGWTELLAALRTGEPGH